MRTRSGDMKTPQLVPMLLVCYTVFRTLVQKDDHCEQNYDSHTLL